MWKIAASGRGSRIGRSGAIRTDERMEDQFCAECSPPAIAPKSRNLVNRPPQPGFPLGTTANKGPAVVAGRPVRPGGPPSAFRGIVGTSIVSIFGVGFAHHGVFSVEQARREEGLLAGWLAAHRSQTRAPALLPGRQDRCGNWWADRTTRRLVGGSVIGEDGAAGPDQRNRYRPAKPRMRGRRVFEQLDLGLLPSVHAGFGDPHPDRSPAIDERNWWG